MMAMMNLERLVTLIVRLIDGALSTAKVGGIADVTEGVTENVRKYQLISSTISAFGCK
jgi:hypothetical protein